MYMDVYIHVYIHVYTNNLHMYILTNGVMYMYIHHSFRETYTHREIDKQTQIKWTTCSTHPNQAPLDRHDHHNNDAQQAASEAHSAGGRGQPHRPVDFDESVQRLHPGAVYHHAGQPRGLSKTEAAGVLVLVQPVRRGLHRLLAETFFALHQHAPRLRLSSRAKEGPGRRSETHPRACAPRRVLC